MLQALEFLGAHRPAVEALCKAFAVKQLRLFGSAANGAWNPATSDIDFVVEFDSAPPGMDLFDQYIKLKEALEAIFGRSVDLVELSAVKNEFFRRNLERTSLGWYAA